MRRVVLCLMVALVVGLGADPALAGYGYGYGGYYYPNQVQIFVQPRPWACYGGPYGAYYGGNYGRYYGGYDAFTAEARRIHAEHSPERYFTHPRSLLNGPPVYSYYGGWGYGY